jgi:hypothetical protein
MKNIIMIIVLACVLQSCGTKKKCDAVNDQIDVNNKMINDIIINYNLTYNTSIITDSTTNAKLTELKRVTRQLEDYQYKKCGIWGFD